MLRSATLGLGVFIAAIIGTVTSQSASFSAPSFDVGYLLGADRVAPRSGSASVPSSAPVFGDVHRGDQGDAPVAVDGRVTEIDGVLPDGVTVFDDEYPGIANLDQSLLRALRAAASDAGGGIKFSVRSGWRSPAYQDQLLRAAVSRYGSKDAAARWVATADTSPHVAGKAVDIGSVDAIAWLSKHGARYGLCQIYRNEPWHFELRPTAITRGCPSMYTDPTRDPRMQP
jgi:hypothetical protein